VNKFLISFQNVLSKFDTKMCSFVEQVLKFCTNSHRSSSTFGDSASCNGDSALPPAPCVYNRRDCQNRNIVENPGSVTQTSYDHPVAILLQFLRLSAVTSLMYIAPFKRLHHTHLFRRFFPPSRARGICRYVRFSPYCSAFNILNVLISVSPQRFSLLC